VPAKLSDEVAQACAQAAVTAHTTLGLRDFSRSDLIVDAENEVWFLEVNVAPGMTETSLVPLAFEAEGLDLGAVCADLVRLAVARA
jgi:D-alanine-D-alanine ligase